MTPKFVGKTILLGTADVVTTIGVSTALNRGIMKIAPSLGEWDEEWTRKEKAIQTAKLLGVVVGIALVAGAAASVVHNAIDDNLWNDDIEVNLIEN
jgi:MFS-type transporter involved in bile tolerance (Atg22 family)